MLKYFLIRAFFGVWFAGCGLVLQAQNLALLNVDVYASPSARKQVNVTVLIEAGLIKAVGPHVSVPRGTESVQCKGCTVISGFWNAHVHFTEDKWQEAQSKSADVLTRQMDDMINRSGFTTVVDTGSDTENTSILRARIAQHEVSGPRIFTAGVPLFPAHALPFYLDELPARVVARMAQPETALQASGDVDVNRDKGADILKLFTGSIVSPQHIVPMRLPIAMAATANAHLHGQLVFAHTSNLEGTQIAIEAGVDVLAHTPEAMDGIGEPVLRRMVARHMTIIPTLGLFSHDDDIEKIRGLDVQYLRLGGRLVYGTDTGFLKNYSQEEEFHQLDAAGFTFRQIMAMLTTAPTSLFHLSKSEGEVRPGMRGDLTVLSEDPASVNPEAFTRVRYTVRTGIVIWRWDGKSQRPQRSR